MAEEGFNKEYSISFYAGADYGLDPEYGKDFLFGAGMSYRVPVSTLGLATDPRTANQLQEISKSLNTGATTIETGGLSPEVFESIPEQHLTEINRLKKLAGVDLTFHGPLVEPTGARQGWNEAHRKQAERQIWQAVERAHKLDPKGNLVVTFHSSHGLPDPMTFVKDEKTGKEQIKDFWIVDETTGRFENQQLKPDYFRSTEGEYQDTKSQIKAVEEAIKKQNKDLWFRQLQAVSFHANNGAAIVNGVLSGREIDDEEVRNLIKRDPKSILAFYDSYVKGKEMPKLIEKSPEEVKKEAEKISQVLIHGDLYLRDAYQELQKLFNEAYAVAKRDNRKEDLEKLDAYREEIKEKVKDIENPLKLQEFAAEIMKGVNVLRSIDAPQAFQPLRKFAIEKSAETFANVAFNAYDKFKDSAPIIAIENPPVGMGLARADDLRDVVNVTREKLKNKLIEEKKMSEKKAEEVAEKLVGVTWDVGHINMLRKYGYSEKDLIKETEKVAPLVKKVHLSDNFGMEHTELPMGMGNVPIKAQLEAINKYNAQVKKIIEAGNWYQYFKTSPFRESLRAFGSPLYATKMAPYWNQISYSAGGYFAGYGQTLPDQHFSMYGAGFSTLPPELGGQMAGRSRISGAPVD